MQRTKISELSAEEALNESVFQSFERLLHRARDAELQALAIKNAVFRALEAMCIDPSEVPTAAENASNLEEAINCYVQYGEYTRSGIMREVRKAYLQNMESRKEHIHEPA